MYCRRIPCASKIAASSARSTVLACPIGNGNVVVCIGGDQVGSWQFASAMICASKVASGNEGKTCAIAASVQPFLSKSAVASPSKICRTPKSWPLGWDRSCLDLHDRTVLTAGGSTDNPSCSICRFSSFVRRSAVPCHWRTSSKYIDM